MNPPSTRLATPPLLLLVLLIAFPQLSETLYAPVLPHIASAFQVDAATAQRTMSLYFLAFAVGVVVWGRVADRLGRRPAMLAGLACYAIGAMAALLAPAFDVLLAARVLLAFGASAGSVVVQTMLRDRFDGARLAAVFSVIGATLSLSPALGPPLGALLALHFGHIGAFCLLAVIGIGLTAATWRWLPETRPDTTRQVPLWQVARQVAADHRVWVAACQVAGFNLLLFGYYTLTPFTLQQLGWPIWVFGLTGIGIALGSIAGAWLNRRLLRRYRPAQLVHAAVVCSVLAAGLQVGWLAVANGSPRAALAGLMLCQLLLMLAYGCAIPNLLATALDAHAKVRGTAAAWFGLGYYLMLAAGLGLVGLLHRPEPLYQPLAMLVVTLLLLPTLLLRSRA